MMNCILKTLFYPWRRLHPGITRLVRWLFVLAFCTRAGVLSAGGSPETTLIVVNADSPLSLQVANLYAGLRNIPDTHIVRLSDIPVLRSINTDIFFTRIWQPINTWLQRHELKNEIDTIAYSADFPYDVIFKKDLNAAGIEKHPQVGITASLTGMTFYAPLAEHKRLAFLTTNMYYRRNLANRRCVATNINVEKTDLQAYQQGKQALRDEQPGKALEIFTRLVKDYPAHDEVHLQLARAHAGIGQYGPALAALQDAANHCLNNSLVMQSDPYLKQLGTHPAFQRIMQQINSAYGPFQPAHGFRSRYQWTGADTPLQPGKPAATRHYMLSTLLAYSGPRGNSLTEIDRYLRAAASSDATQPDGTVYLLANNNIRSTARQPMFNATVKALQDRGHKARILSRENSGQDGVLPTGVNDIIGAVLGSVKLKWFRAHSEVMPGAIMEALTSYGGKFRSGKQTKLTENLRQGAAGSSGAVAEPYAIQSKFPAPHLHVHYADGSSLAEAFYQSILTPYQLIIVGDPLARPFARLASIELAAPSTKTAWDGIVEITPRILHADKQPVKVIELWVDGQHVGDGLPGSNIVWDTTRVEDGEHELRLVAVDDSAIETRSSSSFVITVANGSNSISVRPVDAPVPLGDMLRFSGKAEGANRVDIFRGFEVFATVPVRNGSWSVEVPADKPGMGNSNVFVRGYFPDGSMVRSHRVPVQVTAPARMAATGNATGSQDGLWVDIEYQDGSQVSQTINGIIRKAFRYLIKHKPPITRLQIRGEFRVLQDGFHELVFSTAGKLEVKVNDHVVLDKAVQPDGGDAIVGLGLEAGWHRLDLVLQPEGRLRLEGLLTGDDAGVLLSRKRVRHSVAANK